MRVMYGRDIQIVFQVGDEPPLYGERRVILNLFQDLKRCSQEIPKLVRDDRDRDFLNEQRNLSGV